MNDSPDQSRNKTIRLNWQVRGGVQGVGFRPFVYRLAYGYGLSGFIRNDGRGVTIEAQGLAGRIERFAEDLVKLVPPMAVIERIDTRRVASHDAEAGFTIMASGTGKALQAQVTVDTAVCKDCLSELLGSSDRRSCYGLINCTNCGPRYSILQDVPYDRANTTMAGFQMCDTCRSEYTNPSDRRFHAQPITCRTCGPTVELADSRGRRIVGDPVTEAAALLEQGKIIAIKGLGGFHLAARADDEQAVGRLRRLKRRDAKPFAVMCASVRQALQHVRLSDRAIDTLQSPASPIVLATRRSEITVAAAVAPQNHRLGVMLPSTPIHHLLFASEGLKHIPLVMTSGNLCDEPLAIDNRDALARLGKVCDTILWHDRPIERCVDDSVLLDVGDDDPLPVRRARGYVPGELPLPCADQTQGLCVGGELKSTAALVRGGQAILSQHLGDLKHPLALVQFKKTIDDLTSLFGVEPDWVAHDLHPSYLSTTYAKALAERWDVPLISIQHHHAHAAAVLAEHDHRGPALAVVCDGTGYGTDGTAWGGELLLANLVSSQRLARLRPLVLPGVGGDMAAKDTRRCGLALLYQALGDDFGRHPAVERLVADARESQVLTTMIRRGFNCVPSSSTGRVFDGVASLLGLCETNRFEAQAAVALEAAASEADGVGHRITDTLFAIHDDNAGKGMRQIDLSPFVHHLSAIDVAADSAAELASMFHEVLAAAWERVVIEASGHTGVRAVVLSGGVFCNQILMRRLTERLARHGLDVMRHRLVPPNDGGLSYGQAAIASASVAQQPAPPRRSERVRRVAANPSFQPVCKERTTCV